VRGAVAERLHVLEDALRRAPDASPRLRARALTAEGNLLAEVGHAEQAAASFEASLALANETGEELEIADALLGLRRLDAALARYRRLGDDLGIASALHLLGNEARDRGDLVRARALLQESLALTPIVGGPWLTAALQHSLADCALDESMIDEAARLYHESLDVGVRMSLIQQVAYSLGGLAAVEARRGRPESAARLWRAVQAFERESGYLPLQESERSRYGRALSEVPPYVAVEGAGWADLLADAVAYAHSLTADDSAASSA
jgi:tetratricopeptide (TPR) repeat protein